MAGQTSAQVKHFLAVQKHFYEKSARSLCSFILPSSSVDENGKITLTNEKISTILFELYGDPTKGGKHDNNFQEKKLALRNVISTYTYLVHISTMHEEELPSKISSYQLVRAENKIYAPNSKYLADLHAMNKACMGGVGQNLEHDSSESYDESRSDATTYDNEEGSDAVAGTSSQWEEKGTSDASGNTNKG